jgi:hypothetical protein
LLELNPSFVNPIRVLFTTRNTDRVEIRVPTVELSTGSFNCLKVSRTQAVCGNILRV